MSIPRTRPSFLPATLVTLAVSAAALAAPAPLPAQDLPSIEEHTQGTTAMEGFFNLYWDDATGSLYWEIADLDSEFLYQISMGVGAWQQSGGHRPGAAARDARLRGAPHRAAGAAGGAQLRVPGHQRQRVRGAGGA